MVGLNPNDADLESVVERARSSADDVDSLDEMEILDHEPSVRFEAMGQ